MRGKLQKGIVAVVAISAVAAVSFMIYSPKNMSKKEYLREVDKLGEVSENFYTVFTEWAENITEMDVETAKAGVEHMKEIIKGYGEIAQIENPPREYRDIHNRLTEGLDKLIEAFGIYFDSLIAGLEERPLSEEEVVAVQKRVMDQIDNVSVILDELQMGKP